MLINVFLKKLTIILGQIKIVKWKLKWNGEGKSLKLFTLELHIFHYEICTTSTCYA